MDYKYSSNLNIYPQITTTQDRERTFPITNNLNLGKTTTPTLDMKIISITREIDNSIITKVVTATSKKKNMKIKGTTKRTMTITEEKIITVIIKKRVLVLTKNKEE